MYVAVSREDYEKFIEQKTSLEYKVRDMFNQIINLRNISFNRNLSSNAGSIVFCLASVSAEVPDDKTGAMVEVCFPSDYLFDDNYLAKEKATIGKHKKVEEVVDEIEKKIRIQQAKDFLTKEGIIRDSL